MHACEFMLQHEPSSIEEFGIGLCVQFSCVSSGSPRLRESALCFACELCASAAAILGRGGQLYALRVSFMCQHRPSPVVQVYFALYKILYSMATNWLQACFFLLSELLPAKCAVQLHYCIVAREQYCSSIHAHIIHGHTHKLVIRMTLITRT